MAVAPKKTTKPKAVAKPKTMVKAKGSNLKKDGTAPGSKEKAIMSAERKAQDAYRKGSATSGLKDLVGKGSGSKAVKELDAMRKSVGWKKSNYGTGAQSTITPKGKKPKK
jgi:hypothetical protein